MDKQQWLAERFEENRGRLRAVAYRMLGSRSEADDAVQEAWLRLSRSDTTAVENLGGWLTTVVGRVCLDMLRARKSRREESLDADGAEPPAATGEGESDPEDEAILNDSLGLALLVVLDRLTPAERVAFVLHDVFAVPFEEIAPIVGRSPTAARQLASRARRRVQGTEPDAPAAEVEHRREIVGAFLAAARAGDFDGLLAVLDPDVVLRADPGAARAGVAPETRGAAEVVRTFGGRARGAQPALVDGAPAAVWAPGGTPRVVFDFTIAGGKIVAIDLVGEPDRLREMAVTILDA